MTVDTGLDARSAKREIDRPAQGGASPYETFGITVVLLSGLGYANRGPSLGLFSADVAVWPSDVP